ncbi:uncharacterized protein BDZ99DRAFT_570561 [Mytilinidion resinicola]|uniref:Uncharacterized protein n=1 Tax=Mytilinidion resinicola TaxID=574789 RepID=A0A6A6YPH9_9PEZI|nr:uncharacterized protein BDZ99DRAFT_570561 [Mytilinidion resinicola]KAF2809924.1 hypothetical protein BDZ99DRAFT_570561 [Mytilinidion resinicola]
MSFLHHTLKKSESALTTKVNLPCCASLATSVIASTNTPSKAVGHISYVVRGETLPLGDYWGVRQSSYFQRVHHSNQYGGSYYTFLLDPRSPQINTLSYPEISRLPLDCRQLYKETVLLPYDSNVWSFEDAHVFRQFVEKDRKWPVAQRRAVRTVMTASELYVKDLWKKLFLRLERVVLRGRNGELTCRPAVEEAGY